MKLHIGAITCVLALAAPAAFAESPPVFLLKWGSSGTGPGQFSTVLGLTVDPSGSVFVLDVGNHRVQKFTNEGAYVGEVTHPSFSPDLYGISSDAAGRIYVGASGQALVFDSDLNLLNQWSTLGYMSQIAVDPDGQTLYLASGTQVLKFRTTDGALLGYWRADTITASVHAGPFAVGNDHRVYMGTVDETVRVFTPDGVLLVDWGGPGTGDGQFSGMGGLSLDGSGNVYVMDGMSSVKQIQKLRADGTFVLKWGSEGADDGQFYSMAGICIDTQSNVFILDDSQYRVQKFGTGPTSVRQASWGRLKALFR